MRYRSVELLSDFFAPFLVPPFPDGARKKKEFPRAISFRMASAGRRHIENGLYTFIIFPRAMSRKTPPLSRGDRVFYRFSFILRSHFSSRSLHFYFQCWRGSFFIQRIHSIPFSLPIPPFFFLTSLNSPVPLFHESLSWLSEMDGVTVGVIKSVTFSSLTHSIPVPISVPHKQS